MNGNGLPGRFTVILDALVFNMAMEETGCDDELGGEGQGVWFGLLKAPLVTDETWAMLTEGEREFILLHGAGAIISEDSDGFGYVEYFPTTSALTIAWARLQVRSGLHYVPLADVIEEAV